MKHITRQLIIIALTVFAGILDTSAQERTINLLVKNEARFDHLIPDDMKYIMPQFEECTILTSYGEEYTALANVNITTGALNIISLNGDTLGAAISDDIIRITAADHTILRKEGKFLSAIAEQRSTALCALPSLKIEMFSPSDPVTEALLAIKDKVSLETSSYTLMLNSGHNPHNFQDNKDMVIVRCTYSTQYVITIRDRIHPCKLNSFLKAFPKKKKAIRNYVKTYYTDFSNEDSLRMLFEFCAGLRQ